MTSGWARELWEYYRVYTHSAVHAASVAALTIFGLLVFVDPLFVVLAIASYVCPPLVLYTLEVDLETDATRPEATGNRAPSSDSATGARISDPNRTVGDGNSDADSDGGNGDADSDTDSDDGDTDSDSDDGDTDSDSDG